MKKELSEKQLEAKRLYNQIIRLKMTEVPFQWKDRYRREREDVCLICVVNGTKYIRKHCFGNGVNFIIKMEKEGLITGNDYLICRRSDTKQYQGGASTMIKVDVMLKLKDEMLEYIRNCEWESDIAQVEHAYDVINDTSVVIYDNIIDENVLKESQSAAIRRQELLLEDKADKREERLREIKEQRERDKILHQQSQESETLKDLVAKIEAMGWDVTLSLKPV